MTIKSELLTVLFLMLLDYNCYSQYTFQNYLDDEALYKQYYSNRSNYSNSNDYKRAINELKSIKNIGRSRDVYHDIAKYYYLLKDRDNFIKYFIKAVKLSYNPRHLNPESEFKEYAKDVQDIYNKYYNYNIDSNLRSNTIKMSIADKCVREAVINITNDIAVPEERKADKATLTILLENRKNGIKSFHNTDSLLKVLKQEWRITDSVNLVSLIKIVQETGWTGIDKVGLYNSKEGEPCPIIVIHHSDELIHDWFYPLIQKSCEEGRESWDRMILLNTGYIYYFLKPDYPFSKLKYIYLKNEKKINRESSFLQTYSIAKWMKDNPKLKYEFYITQSVNPLYQDTLLSQLKSILLEQGISKDRLFLRKEIIELDTILNKRILIDLPHLANINNNYYFVLKKAKE